MILQHNLARLFADDTSISYSGSNFETMETDINNDLINLINEWAQIWLVDFNPKKTKALVITNATPPEINIEFSGENVEIINDHKHVSVTLSSDVNWTTHIDNITTSALKRVYVLRKLKFTLSKKDLSNIYITFIRPLLEYACDMWDGCFEYDSEKIEKI